MTQEKLEKWNQKVLNWRLYDKKQTGGRLFLKWKDEHIKGFELHWQRKVQYRENRGLA